ncbi:MAG: VOC family protein [Ramlibacter sp.]|nr:VOC family protein [Ramlibacter sp.]
MKVQPYLNFDGRAEEALGFYTAALGASVGTVMRFSDAPEGTPVRPGVEDKIMHADFTVGEATLMASDGYCTGSAPAFQGITLSLTADDDAAAQRLFDALLAGGGTVQMPLAKTFFASSFGMLTDRFGVGWMVLAGNDGAAP